MRRPCIAKGGEAMGIFLSKRELAQTEPAEKLDFKSPVPTRMVSNGEFNPLPQTRRQRQFEERLSSFRGQRQQTRDGPPTISPHQLRHGGCLCRAERRVWTDLRCVTRRSGPA